MKKRRQFAVGMPVMVQVMALLMGFMVMVVGTVQATPSDMMNCAKSEKCVVNVAVLVEEANADEEVIMEGAMTGRNASNLILPFHQIELHKLVVKCDLKSVVESIAQQKLNLGGRLHGVIPAQCDKGLTIDLVTLYDMLIISPSSMNPALTEFQNFARSTYKLGDAFAEAITLMSKQYEWSRIGVVYTADATSVEFVADLLAHLKNNDAQVLEQMYFPQFEGEQNEGVVPSYFFHDELLGDEQMVWILAASGRHLKTLLRKLPPHHLGIVADLGYGNREQPSSTSGILSDQEVTGNGNVISFALPSFGNDRNDEIKVSHMDAVNIFAHLLKDAFLEQEDETLISQPSEMSQVLNTANTSFTMSWRGSTETSYMIINGEPKMDFLRLVRFDHVGVMSDIGKFDILSKRLQNVPRDVEDYFYQIDSERISDAGVSGTFQTVIILLCCLVGTLLCGGLFMKRIILQRYLYQTSDSWRVQFSDLQLIKKLGEGAFGSVYKAKWRGKDVAVKLFDEDKFKTVQVSSFILEVAILHEMRHPNIVLFMGACFEKPTMCIVTELLRCSLYDQIQALKDSSDKLPWADRLNILLDSCLGMSYLHEIGILHHDLKSPNILLGIYNQAKVADFGMISLKPGTRKKGLVRKSTEYFDQTRSKPAPLKVVTSPTSGDQRNVSSVGSTESFKGGSSSGPSSPTQQVPRKSSPMNALLKMNRFAGGGGGGSQTNLLKPTLTRAKSNSMLRKSTKRLKLFSENQDNGAGTPQWTAPEVIEGHEFTEKADVFAFGVIMAEVSALTEPYPGMSHYEVTLRVTEGLRPDFGKECPTDIKMIANMCLHADAKQRPTFSRIAQLLQNLKTDWEADPPSGYTNGKSARRRLSLTGASLKKISKGPSSSAQDYSERVWWLDKHSVNTVTILSCNEYSTTAKGDMTNIPGERNYNPNGATFQPKEHSGGFRARRMSLHLFSNGPEKNYMFSGNNPSLGNSATLRTGGSKTSSLAGSLIFPSFGTSNKPPPSIVEPIVTRGKPVVVKTIKMDDKTQLAKLFAAEMDIRFRLSHSNIEVILGGWIDTDELVMVKEYPPYGSLRQILDTTRHVYLRIHELLEGVDGLAFLHSRETPIIHKDVKSDNFLCFKSLLKASVPGTNDVNGSSSLGVKLTGFMFDFVPNTLSLQPQKLGTPAFSPPEVILGEQYGPESDVYGLGFVMWEILTRKVPFENKGFQEIGRLVCAEQKRPDIPSYDPRLHVTEKGFDIYIELMQKCWDADPKNRPTLEALKNVLITIE